MSNANDGPSSSSRRRSMGIFPRQPLSGLTPLHTRTGQGEVLKKKRPNSFFFGSSTGAESDLKSPEDPPASSKIKGRPLRKDSRPANFFGSMRSMPFTSTNGDGEARTGSIIPREDPAEEESEKTFVPGHPVIHHGEVQTTGGLFKKKKEYLVLTERHLVRFKTQQKAAEIFSVVPTSLARTNTNRHHSMSSNGSMSDLPTVASSADPQHCIPLRQIIAVYKVEDGRPYFSVEITHLTDDVSRASSMILQLGEPREADVWLSAIRTTATKLRLSETTPFSRQSVEYVARKLEQERDYHPDHFRIFKVVKRPINAAAGRASSDDLSKLDSTVCYLAIGLHMIHLVPLPRNAQRHSSVSLSDKYERAIFGLMALTLVNIRECDDAFELGFREPLKPTQWLCLASCDSLELGIWIRQAVQYLRPQWVVQPVHMHAPAAVEESVIHDHTPAEDFRSFDRTLTAYCAAYHLDTSLIRYAVLFEVSDAPQFTLFPPAHPKRTTYLLAELLAVFRSLRYNEYFNSISFAGVSLDVLHGIHDEHGDPDRWCSSRNGTRLNCKRDGSNSLLVQEVQLLALKSRKLRRMDFSFAIERKPIDQDEELNSYNNTTYSKDAGCEIVEALYPICRRQYTNLDWITLNGIEMGDTDLDYLVDAMVHRTCHFRACEFSHCGLTDRMLTLILNAMLSQDRTLESIDISRNLARVSPSAFQGQIGHFSYIRKLNLSRLHRTSGPEPLVAPETLLTWRLEYLELSETALNAQTVDSLSAYLSSPMSDTLREIWLDQCGLKGKDIAMFMHSMSRAPGKARELHLHVSENRIEEGHDDLVSAIASGRTPSHLTMSMAVYDKESQFRELLQALRHNTSLRYLDISKAWLPWDANEETCETLKLMFAENTSLEEFDISGEHAHLEVAKLGIGLNHALTGLTHNASLKILRIEYQKLGFQGANTLSSVLEHNEGLREIYCENNDINLQGLTVLVNALRANRTILYIPSMAKDRAEALQMVEREIESMRVAASLDASAAAASNSKTTSVRRKIASTVAGRSITTSINNTGTGMGMIPNLTPQDIDATIEVIKGQWDRLMQRLESQLIRNRNIANGMSLTDLSATNPSRQSVEGIENERPQTAESTNCVSLSAILEKVQLGTTPTVEKPDSLANAGTLLSD